MSTGRGERETLSFGIETVAKTIPASVKEFWHNTETLEPQRANFASGRSLGDFQTSDVRLGRKSIVGDVVSELCFTNHDDQLACLMRDEWLASVVSPVTAITIAADATLQQFTDSGSGFGSFVANTWILVSGFTTAANNGLFFVTAKAAGALTVVGPTGTALVTEAAGDSVTVRPVNFLHTGTTEQTATIQRRNLDLSLHEFFTGCSISQGALTIPPNGIVTMTWTVLGAGYDNVTSVMTPASAGLDTASPFDGLSGLYSAHGVATTIMTAFNATVANNTSLTEVLGQDESDEAINRRFNITGSVSFLFQNRDHFTRFWAETETSLVVSMVDPAGNMMPVVLPRIKYTSHSKPKNDDGPQVITCNWMALKHATIGTMAAILQVPVV